MHWLADYWWVILVLFVGVILNAIKDLKRVDHKKYLQNRRELPPHRDNKAQWDDEDDWPDNKSKKS
ncbi:TPA: YpfN family protein [Morganella morganii]|uniref:YpfN family protein n=1 Tax=Morganella morganii TaxID=582 RepID=UPI0022A50BB5|nr:YpfN family protein [Morganella morganii]